MHTEGPRPVTGRYAIDGMPDRRGWVDRPSSMRLFARIDGIVLDDAGNCREAVVDMLDRIDGEVVWRPWHVGRGQHFHPFVVRLMDTRRAGLHLTCHWRRPGEDEPRFATAFPLREPGILVISPANVVCLAEPLQDAMLDDIECIAMRSNLVHRYGWSYTAKMIHLARRPRLDEETHRLVQETEDRLYEAYRRFSPAHVRLGW